MDITITRLVNETDFSGYVIIDWDGVFGKTTCPNTAVSMCLERSRTGGKDLEEYVKAYFIGTMGKYHHTPGERYVSEYDWENALRQLFC
jgi:hypothetical protein